MHLESWPRSIQGGNRTSLIKIGGKGATSGRHSDIVTFNSVLQQHTCRSGAEGNGAHSANGAHIMYEVECISASDCCGSSGTFSPVLLRHPFCQASELAWRPALDTHAQP